jgi:hypothetical protein
VKGSRVKVEKMKENYKFQITNIIARHDAADLVRIRMKIMLSISPSYCRGLIYKARPGRFIHGFDESNPYDRIYITKHVYFFGRQK